MSSLLAREGDAEITVVACGKGKDGNSLSKLELLSRGEMLSSLGGVGGGLLGILPLSKQPLLSRPADFGGVGGGTSPRVWLVIPALPKTAGHEGWGSGLLPRRDSFERWGVADVALTLSAASPITGSVTISWRSESAPLTALIERSGTSPSFAPCRLLFSA